MHKTHYGHKTALGHLRIPNTDRLAIAGRIAQGVDFQHILDNIRDSLGQQFHRIHLLTRKDVTNMERSYGLKGAQRHKDDATSVNIWVEEMKSCEGNIKNKADHRQMTVIISLTKISYWLYKLLCKLR